MWLFSFFLFGRVAMELYSQSLSDRDITNFWMINIISAYSVCFYLSLIAFFINNKKVRRITLFLGLFFVIYFIASCLFIKSIKQLHTFEFSVGYFIVICACIYFFYELLSYPNDVKLLRSPSFWIVTGVLFNHAGQLPVYLFLDFIVTQKYYVVNSIFFMVHFLDIMLNVLIIIAFLCRLNLPKRSLSY